MPDPTDRTLLLLRHAKSSWDEPLRDHDRPLSARGVRDAGAVGRLFVERGWRPDLVLCSTAERTRQTWAYAESAGAQAGEVRYTELIYAATAADLIDVVQSVPAEVDTLLLIGHGPGLPDLAEDLAGGIPRKYATSGLAAFRLPYAWSRLGRSREPAELLAFEIPRG